MELIRELMQLTELADPAQAGDPEADAAIADINKKFGVGSQQANDQIARWKQQRLRQVSPRIRSLLQQKERMIQQIDAQIARERAKGSDA